MFILNTKELYTLIRPALKRRYKLNDAECVTFCNALLDNMQHLVTLIDSENVTIDDILQNINVTKSNNYSIALVQTADYTVILKD